MRVDTSCESWANEQVPVAVSIDFGFGKKVNSFAFAFVQRTAQQLEKQTRHVFCHAG
jgi:hypothetical protein